MKSMCLALCAAMFVCHSSWAQISGDAGAPEVKGELKCEIRVASKSAKLGSAIPILMTVENIGDLAAELPSPGTPEPGMRVRVFLLATDSTDTVRRVWLPNGVLDKSPSLEQQRVMKERRPEDWHRYFGLKLHWISIPPKGKQEFRVFAAMSPKAYNGSDYGSDVAVTPGNYGIQCEIEYEPLSVSSAAFIETNGLTSAGDIAKAKASGAFLLDTHRLWTGKMESNIVPITLTGSGQ